ncbi:10127_t:CDS:1, partial [Acaulospora colombiana]
VKGAKNKRQKTQAKINSMLDAIDTENQSSTTKRKYPILRIVVSFPLVADFNSRAKKVRDALNEDHHPLALLSTSALTSVLATIPEGLSIAKQLRDDLKRKREFNQGDSGGPPLKKRK